MYVYDQRRHHHQRDGMLGAVARVLYTFIRMALIAPGKGE